MMPRSALFDLCEGALQSVVSRWPDDADPLPARQLVSDGDVYWDCEQLAVQAESAYPTTGDVRTQQYWDEGSVGLRAVVISVWLMRCVPDMDTEGDDIVLPSAEEITDAARVLLGDANTVLDLLVVAQKSGELATCQGFTFDGWSTVGPSGGFAASVTRFRAQLLPQDDGT